MNIFYKFNVACMDRRARDNEAIALLNNPQRKDSAEKLAYLSKAGYLDFEVVMQRLAVAGA